MIGKHHDYDCYGPILHQMILTHIPMHVIELQGQRRESLGDQGPRDMGQGLMAIKT